MITAETCFRDLNNSPVRHIRGRVELYEGSTLLKTFRHTDLLKSLTVERVGDSSKFFGFGVVHKLNVHIIDKNRELNITTANTLDVAFGVGSDFIYPFPFFKVSEVHRDENTNELSITAYDALYQANNHTIKDLNLPIIYTLGGFANNCAALLGVPLNTLPDGFDIEYPGGANFEGTETVREGLDALAEATQTIYYLNNELALTFKRLDIEGEAAKAITKDRYFTLQSKTNRRLAAICSATELGDNVSAALEVSGTTQYIRDNPFWELRDDITTLVNNALAKVGGLTINQFTCEWRGNFLLEVGDKITLTTKDNDVVAAYLLDDTITYDGAFKEKTQWNYTEDESQSESNPTSLGETIKQTYARVDKANKEISLLASETRNNTENISNLMMNTESIAASVREVDKRTSESLDSMNSDVLSLTKSVEARMTAEDVQIKIQSELENGVGKVITATGFTFNEEGLTVSKTGSEMETQITEDGMTVSKNGSVVLTANNVGVDAVNLHATTYLIIGQNSRFEDYNGRTGCFWIGG